MKRKVAFGITAALLLISLFAISPIATAPTLPKMYLAPSTLTVDQGSTFTLEVWVENVNDMYAWEFKIGIDVTILTVLKPPKEGPFLKSGGFDTFFAWTYNPQAGVLLVGCTRLGNVPGVSGTGKIAELGFIADEPGQTTTVDLFDDKKYDSSLNMIPQDVPGDAVVTVQWPPEFWDTELWLQKIWPKHKVIYMTWCCDTVLVWGDQTIYARVKNTGTAGVYVRVWMAFTNEVGYTEDWDPYENVPLTTVSAYIGPGETVVLSMEVGCIDPLWCVVKPPSLVFECGWFYITGQLQISNDGSRWYNWGDFDPPLPGDGFSRVTPGHDTAKFKVFCSQP